MPPSPLRPRDVARLLALPNSARVAAVLRPSHRADWTLAHLLSKALPSSQLTILTTPSATSMLQNIPLRGVQPVLSDVSSSLSGAARWAVSNGVPHLAVARTRVSDALTSLTRLDAGRRHVYAGGAVTGLETLPPGLLSVHTPFVDVDEADIDASFPSAFEKHLIDLPTEVQRARDLLGEDTPSVNSLLEHVAHRAASMTFLHEQSEALLQKCILEASHWGYIVARRSALLDVYASGKGGRYIAVHAMNRMVMHVSGASEMLSPDDENVTRLLHAMLSTDAHGILRPLPKGRTAAGMVVRPATGRFAKRVLQAERRLGRRPKFMREHPDDLMILTREPDHETGTLVNKRLRGNYSCTPLTPDGTPAYWDNRFVLSAAPVSHLDRSQVPFEPSAMISAALSAGDTIDQAQALVDCEMYVRQLRKTDWERITSITTRVRDFHVPYECIRALPAVFQKTRGSTSMGELVASPHLGISSRHDLYFTAVRMPRFRALPEELDPGFSERHLTREKPRRHASSSQWPRRHDNKRPQRQGFQTGRPAGFSR